MSLSAILTDDVCEQIRAPIQEATTLPREAFTAEPFLEAERERIFSASWTALYFTELVQPGEAIPVDLAGIPLLIVRDTDGALRVFHNIVPYDGCLAVIERARDLTAITTPYHGWRYNLSGKLVATPYWSGSVAGTNLDALGDRPRDLAEVRSATWGPVLFVNLSEHPADFDAHVAPLERALEGWDLASLGIARDSGGEPLLYPEDLATNWKTHLENWGINVLHEAFVHDLYHASPEVPRMREDGEKTFEDYVDNTFMALKYVETDFPSTYGEIPFPRLDKDPAEPSRHGFFGSFMPNLHFGIFNNLLHLIISNPVTPARTTTLRAQFYRRDAAQAEEYAEARSFLALGFVEAGNEDGRITEAVQSARQSPAFPTQYYSAHWDTMHYHFSRWVLDQLVS